jgi:hypothetical protein
MVPAETVRAACVTWLERELFPLALGAGQLPLGTTPEEILAAPLETAVSPTA